MTAPDPTITRAGPLHATVLAEIHAQAFPPDECWDARIMAGQLGQQGAFGLIDPRGGMLLARLAADEAEIITLAVIPGQRQKGIGALLLSEALREAGARGAVRMFLEVSTENPAAMALYTRHGFRQVGVRARYYTDGTDALILGREV